MAAPFRAGGGVHRFAYLVEGAAAADVGDGFVDVGIGGLRLVLEQGRHRHDHAALAITALRHVAIDPGLLHLVQHAIRRQPFDGGDLFAGGLGDQHAAGADRDAVDVNGAGAALCNAATIFGAGQAGVFPDRPQERRIRLDIQFKCFAVDREVCHRVSPD